MSCVRLFLFIYLMSRRKWLEVRIFINCLVKYYDDDEEEEEEVINL